MKLGKILIVCAGIGGLTLQQLERQLVERVLTSPLAARRSDLARHQQKSRHLLAGDGHHLAG